VKEPAGAADPLALLRARPWHVCIASLVGGLALAEADAGITLGVGTATGIAFAWLRAPRLAATAAALVLAGSAVGHARLAAIDAPAGRIRDGEYVTVRATLLTAPRPGAFGSSAEVGVRGGRLDGARLLARAARWAPLPASAAIGAELELRGRLSRLRPGAEAGGARSRAPPFDYDAYLRRHGVAGELQLEGSRATGRRRGGLAGLLDRMRGRAEHAVSAGLHGRDAALLRGMVLGQDEQIDEATRDDWRAAGLAHLVAVSGQNVMLLAALALPLLMLAGAGLRTRFVALAVLIAIYVPLAGAGPSLQRAGVMGLAGVAAMAASRPASRWYALLLAGAATLAWNPRAWADPGWQLSFAAVAGILMLGVPVQRVLRKAVDEVAEPRTASLRADRPRADPRAGRIRAAVLRGLADGVALTLAATVATAPLLAHHFGSVPLAGLPANLLALPAVAPAMWLGMLKTALGQLPQPADQLAVALGAVASLPLAYLATLAERCADAPGGQLPLALGSTPAVLAAYASMAIPALLLRRNRDALGALRTDWAARWHAAPRSRRRALAAAGAIAMLGALVLWAAPQSPPDRLTIRFLDVGQGDATLIQHPDGTAVLFDGGPPEAGVTRLLRKAGVRRLALVVATHASRDHHGGLTAVLERFPVDTLLDGGDGTSDPTFHAMLRTAATHGVRRVKATAGLALALAGGELRIRVLSPPPRPPGPPPEDPNPRAIVAIVSCRGFDLMLSADAESEALLPLDLPDVDAMKVPHHGSEDPGLPEVLKRLKPELAGIEVGKGNTYGHPAPSTLKALRHARVPTFRTDRDGTVTVTPQGDRLQVETEH
jgi:competence protein ComEC